MASTSGPHSSPEGGGGSSSPDEPAALISRRAAQAAEITGALKAGDVNRMKKLDKNLKKKGSSLLEAVAASGKDVADRLLHLAARWLQYEACKYLIKDLRMDVNRAGHQGGTPMISAINAIDSATTARKKKDSERIVELLLRNGANPNKPMSDGFTALHAATVKGSVEIAKVLLAHGAQVNAMCQSGNVEAVVQILLDRGVDPGATNVTGFTALHVAVIKDSYDVAELLLEKKAEVDAVCDKGTALLMACETGACVEMVKLLLDYGANAKETNISGFTGLHFATLKDSHDVAKVLLDTTPAGADVHAVCEKGTALHIAAERGSLKLVTLLLQNDANTDVCDKIGRRAIELAAVNGHTACVDKLFACTSPIPEYVDWSVEGILCDAEKQIHG